MRLILASGSPRRKELLQKLGINFEARAADIDESQRQGENPFDYVQRLSIEKAQAVNAGETNPGTFVIGGDVTIDVDGEAMAKAENQEHAMQMLRRIQGRKHFVRNGVAIIRGGETVFAAVETTIVTFKQLTDQQIQNYIEQTTEWQDKAGAYASQGAAGEFVSTVTGSFYNLLGFPVYTVAATLTTFGFDIPASTIENIRREEHERLVAVLNM